MRIKTITDKFIDRRNCSGAYMKSTYDRETQTQILAYRRNSDKLIAEIYDYKNPQNYRLRIHPHPSYSGRTAHNNRVYQILFGIQMPEGRNGNWQEFRYSTYIRYAIKVWDRKVSVEYELKKPMEFQLTDGRLTIDYKVLEQSAYPDETPAPVVLDENSNLQSVNNKLTAILAGV